MAFVEQILIERDDILHQLKNHLHQAQNKMSVQMNKHYRELYFEVGEMIYLRVWPFRLKPLANKQNEKLSTRYISPYWISDKIGSIAYKLELPHIVWIHLIIYIS